MEGKSKLPKISFYSLEFSVDVDNGSMYVEGSITVENNTQSKFNEFPILLYHDLKVISITDKYNSKISYDEKIELFDNNEKHKVNYILVKIDNALLPNEEITINIEYEGVLSGYTDVMRYVKDSINTEFSILREDCFAYPCLAYPSWESFAGTINNTFEYNVKIIVPEGITAACGGILKNVEKIEDKRKFTYESLEPTWRFDISISEYDVIEDSEMNLKIFSFPWDKAFAENRVKKEIKRAYDYFLSSFGDYPSGNYFTVIEILEGYGSQAGDNYINMEEHGFKEGSMLTHLYHEIGHGWNAKARSDVQRCRFFDEAFACYFEALAIREFLGEEEYQKKMESYRKKYIQNVERDRQCFDVPISEYYKHDLGYNSYTKGPWVLYCLHETVGEDNFFSIIREFLSSNKGKEVDFNDFQVIAEEVSGIDLNGFFKEWIYGTEASRYLCEGKHCC